MLFHRIDENVLLVFMVQKSGGSIEQLWISIDRGCLLGPDSTCEIYRVPMAPTTMRMVLMVPMVPMVTAAPMTV